MLSGGTGGRGWVDHCADVEVTRNDGRHSLGEEQSDPGVTGQSEWVASRSVMAAREVGSKEGLAGGSMQ